MKKSPCLLFFLLLFLCGSVRVCCAQESPRRFLQWLHEDPVSMVTNVGPEQLVTMASFGVGVTMISLGDAASSKNIQQHYKHSQFLHYSNRLGNWKIAGSLSAGIFGASMFTNDTKFQDAAFTSLQSLLVTKLTVNTGKFLFARERPGSQDGPYDFDFAESGATSFPSGHTATAFALITPWVVYYPGLVTYSLMAIPVGTAIARVAKGKHWLSDVTTGAGIGFAIGHYLAKRHLDYQSDRLRIIPSAGQDHFSLTVNFSF